METLERPARKTYLDGLRILAAFGVVYNHAIDYLYFDVPGAVGCAALYAFFLCKTAVPLFFMISGALLLPRADSYRKVGTRVLRMLLVLLLLCVFFWLVRCRRTGEAFTFGNLLRSFYAEEPPGTTVFWFLYCYIAMLFMLPVLQRLTARLRPADYRYYFIAAAVIAGVLPIVRHWWPRTPVAFDPNASVFYAYIWMMLAGVYIDRYAVISRRGMFAAAGALLLLTGLSVALTRLDPKAFVSADCLFYDDRTLLPIVGASASLFYLFRGMADMAPLPGWAAAAVTALGRLTFCVYLSTEYMLGLFMPLRVRLTPYCTAYGAGLLQAMAAFVCALLLAAVLTRVPGLKKLL